MYTDGSVFNGPAGCGACTAVLNPLSVEDGIRCTSKAVGMKVASVTSEIEGIILGMVVSLTRCNTDCVLLVNLWNTYIYYVTAQWQLIWQFKDIAVE